MDGGANPQSLSADNKVWAHNVPSTKPGPDAAEQNRTLTQGLAALKRMAPIKHRKTQSVPALQPSGGGYTANTTKSRNRASSLAKPISKPGIERQNVPAKMKFEITLTPSFLTSRRERLANKLAKASAQDHSTEPERHFIPTGRLDELVTQDSVKRELSRVKVSTYLRHRLWSKTCPQVIVSSGDPSSVPFSPLALSGDAVLSEQERNFQKIFAILVLMKRPHKIWAFIDEGLHDGDLPLCSSRTGNTRGGLLARTNNPDAGLNCLRRNVDKFLEQQWCVLVPSFHPTKATPVPYLKIAAKAILPFEHWDNNGQAGGFGVVHQVRIHQDYHFFDKKEAPANTVAVKKIVEGHRDTFEREYNILCQLRKMEHTNRHLVTLLAAFEKKDQFYLVLPWADLDLHRYWRKKDPNTMRKDFGDVQLSVWILKQCVGLVEAVRTIHHYHTTSGTAIYRDGYCGLPGRHVPKQDHDVIIGPRNSLFLNGRHGDIKPANILWYPKEDGIEYGQGILRLADFGTARFSSTGKISQREGKTIPGSTPYQSPESVLSEGVSGQCDIWALGCVFLEFVCWYDNGCKLVESFEKELGFGRAGASFFGRNLSDTPPRAELKKPVREMMKDLQQRDRIQEDLRMSKLLSVIQKDMLVVSHDGVYRKPAGAIHRKLGSVLQAYPA